MVRFAAALLVAGVAAVGLVTAGGAGKLKLGDKAPGFENLPNASSVGPKQMSLKDFKQDVLVVSITCNHCPVAVAYEDRMVEFAKKYASGKDARVGFVAINVNNLPADKLDKMRIRAEQKGFNFPYLHDESQEIGRKLNARVTPEFYVFNKDRELVYWGSFDDKMSNPTAQYLAPAVDAVLSGSMPTMQQTKAFGCGVKYE